MKKTNTKTQVKHRRGTSRVPVRGSGGKYYKSARLIYYNTDVNKSVVLPLNDDNIALRKTLYEVIRRNNRGSAMRIFKSRIKNKFITITRIV